MGFSLSNVGLRTRQSSFFLVTGTIVLALIYRICYKATCRFLELVLLRPISVPLSHFVYLLQTNLGPLLSRLSQKIQMKMDDLSFPAKNLKVLAPNKFKS